MTFADELVGGEEQKIWRSALSINPLPPCINNRRLYDRLDNMLLSYLREHGMLWQCFVIVEPLCTTEQRESLQLSFADIQQNLQHALKNRQSGIATAGDQDKALVALEELYQTSQKLSDVRKELEQFSILDALPQQGL